MTPLPFASSFPPAPSFGNSATASVAVSDVQSGTIPPLAPAPVIPGSISRQNHILQGCRRWYTFTNVSSVTGASVDAALVSFAVFGTFESCLASLVQVRLPSASIS